MIGTSQLEVPQRSAFFKGPGHQLCLQGWLVGCIAVDSNLRLRSNILQKLGFETAYSLEQVPRKTRVCRQITVLERYAQFGGAGSCAKQPLL